MWCLYSCKTDTPPFPNSSISYIKPFVLLHCDIWGPYKVPYLSGARYFLTIMDDFSRFTWIFFMHHKSETQHLLTNFFSFVKTHFNTNIANIRVDNGKEFFFLCEIFFTQQGTTYQYSCTYTPQQNGFVENKHKHILESAHVLCFQAHFPYTFGQNVFPLLFILLIGCLRLFYHIKHLLSA